MTVPVSNSNSSESLASGYSSGRSGEMGGHSLQANTSGRISSGTPNSLPSSITVSGKSLELSNFNDICFLSSFSVLKWKIDEFML